MLSAFSLLLSRFFSLSTHTRTHAHPPLSSLPFSSRSTAISGTPLPPWFGFPATVHNRFATPNLPLSLGNLRRDDSKQEISQTTRRQRCSCREFLALLHRFLSLSPSTYEAIRDRSFAKILAKRDYIGRNTGTDVLLIVSPSVDRSTDYVRISFQPSVSLLSIDRLEKRLELKDSVYSVSPFPLPSPSPDIYVHSRG